MLLVVITFLLVAVGVIAYWYGAWKLSRYAARISGGLGVGVLLVPPITFWFAFFKLEQEGKELPTTMWLFGMVSTILLVVVFWTPLSMVAQGRMDEIEKPMGVAESAVAAHGMSEDDKKRQDEKDAKKANPSPSPTPEPTPEVPPTPAPATNGSTNNAGGTNSAGTNTAPATNAGTTGAPAQ